MFFFPLDSSIRYSIICVTIFANIRIIYLFGIYNLQILLNVIMKCWVVSWKYIYMYKYPIRYKKLSSVDIGIQNIHFLYLRIISWCRLAYIFQFIRKNKFVSKRENNQPSPDQQGTFYRTYIIVCRNGILRNVSRLWYHNYYRVY